MLVTATTLALLWTRLLAASSYVPAIVGYEKEFLSVFVTVPVCVRVPVAVCVRVCVRVSVRGPKDNQCYWLGTWPLWRN